MSDENGTQPTAPTIPPEAVDALFDDADLAADVLTIARTLDRHRKQILLMWMAVLGLAGVMAYTAIREIRDA